MKPNRIGKKGQISLEFMLLIVFLLVYLSGTMLPAVDLAATTAQEVEGIGQARIATQKIVSTINRLQNQASGARETVTIFVPADANITCDTSNKIGFEFQLKGNPVSSCASNGKCTAVFPTQAASLSCGTGFTLRSGSLYYILGGQTVPIKIIKTSTETTVGS